MTKFPDVFGTTDEYRNQVIKQGFIDLEQIQPEDVIDAVHDRRWLPKFRDVFAIINVTSSQSEFNSILLMANQRLIKCRLTPKTLTSKLGQQFLLDPKHDVGDMAKSIGIKKLIPYVCGNFVLAPVDRKSASNNSWVRLYTDGEVWHYLGAKSLVNYPSVSVLKVPHRKRAMRIRRNNCRQLLYCYSEIAECLQTTIELPFEKMSGETLRGIVARKTAINREEISRELVA